MQSGNKSRGPFFHVRCLLILPVILLLACSGTAYDHYMEQAESKYRRSPQKVEFVPEKPEKPEGEVSQRVINKQRDLRSYVKKNLPVKEVNWEYTMEDTTFRNVWYGPRNIYVETESYSLWAIDPKTGNPKWEYTLNGHLDYRPAFVQGVPEEKASLVKGIEELESDLAAERGKPNPNTTRINTLQNQLDNLRVQRQNLNEEDRIYLLIGTRLYVVDREFGTQLMRRDLGFPPAAPPMATKSILAIPGIRNFTVHFLNANTLWEMEKFAPMGLVGSQPNHIDPMFLYTSFDGNLYAYEGGGDLSWNITTGAPVEARPVTWKHYIYFGSKDMQFYCVNQQSGNILWSQQVGSAITKNATVSSPNVYVLAEDQNFYSFDLLEGTLNWNLKGPKKFLFRSNPRVYTTKPGEKQILAINDRTGEILHRYSYKPFDFVLRNHRKPNFLMATKDGTILSAKESDIGS